MAVIPQRVSLLAQSVESLRQGIASGAWDGYLPPERVLCEELEISRSTLRRAMLKVEEEGLIDAGRSGKRRSIIAMPKPDTVRPTDQRTKKMVWLSRRPLQEIPSVNLRLIAQLQSKLASHNCLLHVLRVPEKVIANPDRNMAGWLDEQSADVWILHLMPEDVQRWFSENQPVSCIFGSPAPNIDLASVEIDSHAAMRHALVMLKRQGHQHIGLVRQDQQLVGEGMLEQIMQESSMEGAMRTSVIRCPLEPSHIAVQFERVFSPIREEKPERGRCPTALICSVPGIALFALTWLQQQRISVPNDVSIVLLRTQPLLAYSSPRLSHYEINESQAITRIFPRLLDLLQSQTCETSHIGLIPEFVQGESVADVVLG